MCHLVRNLRLSVELPYSFSTAKGNLKQEGRSCGYGPKRRLMEESLPQPLAR